MPHAGFLNRLLAQQGASDSAVCSHFVKWERRKLLLDTPFDEATIGEAQGVYLIAMSSTVPDPHPLAPHIHTDIIYVGSVGTFTKSNAQGESKASLSGRLQQFQDSAKSGSGNHAGGNSFYQQFDWPHHGEELWVAVWPVAGPESALMGNKPRLQRMIGLLESLCMTDCYVAKFDKEGRYFSCPRYLPLMNKRLSVPAIFGADGEEAGFHLPIPPREV